jgi:hypothetical protein
MWFLIKESNKWGSLSEASRTIIVATKKRHDETLI